MASTKRERQRANRALRQEEVEEEQVAEERRSRLLLIVPIVLLVLFGLLFLYACGGGDDDSASTSETFATGDINEDTTVVQTEVEDAVDQTLNPFGPIPAEFVPWSGTRQLSGVTQGLRNGLYDSPPPMTIDTALDYTATITTNRGDMVIDLFEDESPITVNNFVSLAEDGYFDGLSFHRVLEDFMAQGGDPTGAGSGGPGYQFEDEVDNGLSFTGPGQLAMANAGPGTNGSQFFITLSATEWLTGNHTIFGELTAGEETLRALRLRDPGTDPALGDLMTSVVISAE